MSKDILQQAQFNILAIGDSCSDVYVFGTCNRLSPEAPVPVFKKIREETRGGMVINVINNLISLGCAITQHSNKEKIIKTRIVDERFNQHLIRIDSEPDIDRIDVSFFNREYIKKFNAIVISDYDKGFLFNEDIKILTKLAYESDVPVFADTKKKDLSCFFNSIIKLNELEARTSTGILKNSKLIVTLGKSGALWNETIYPSKRTDIHDICGAGDVFLACLVYQYLTTRGDIESSIEFANECAAISVSHFGTYTIKASDLERDGE